MFKHLLLCTILMIFCWGTSYAEDLSHSNRLTHLCNPTEYTINDNLSAQIVCQSGDTFHIPEGVNSPNVLRMVLKSKKDAALNVHITTLSDEQSAINVELK